MNPTLEILDEIEKRNFTAYGIMISGQLPKLTAALRVAILNLMVYEKTDKDPNGFNLAQETLQKIELILKGEI